jgi:hypothetical protein
MNSFLEELASKHKKTGILVDTNILLLYFVGCVDRNLIAQFKRTRNFSEDDFLILLRTLDLFDGKVVTTPNILSEVNSLSGQLPQKLRFQYFAVFAEGLSHFDEKYVRSDRASQMTEFCEFGLTDAGIAYLSDKKCAVLTDDLPLYHYLANSGVDAINFNHLRHFT